jgi:tRNA A37 threonylcarbamoyladenosine synthetase subunit TsaC/SUA5/YrdC
MTMTWPSTPPWTAEAIVDAMKAVEMVVVMAVETVMGMAVEAMAEAATAEAMA